MRTVTGLLLVYILIGKAAFLAAQVPEGPADHHPFMIAEGWDLSRVSSEENAFTLTDDSTLVDYNVLLLRDRNGLPEAYTSRITTPVCDDSLCALMHIQVYWDLLGNYVGYDTVAGAPLTKNDHLEFRREDYLKLHGLLSDNNSVIKRKSKSELIDDTKIRVSEVVDAVTGATALEVKEAVVDGALYSSYTIYHIVYGPLSGRMGSYTDSLYTDSLERKLLYSGDPDYQLYALKQVPPDELHRYQDLLLELIRVSIPLNRIYIMKKMPGEMWKNPEVAERISGYFDEMDLSSRSWFLNRLKDLSPLSGECLLRLSRHLRVMTKNQLKTYVELLNARPGEAEKPLVANIQQAIDSQDLIYGYLLEEFLGN